MSKTINIKGNEILVSSIEGFSKLKTFSTGSIACDWVHGFEVYTKSNVIPIHFSPNLRNNPEGVHKAQAELDKHKTEWEELLKG